MTCDVLQMRHKFEEVSQILYGACAQPDVMTDFTTKSLQNILIFKIWLSEINRNEMRIVEFSCKI